MKLAEALILRADLQKRLVQLKQRILDNAKVQEGDAPAEDANRLLAELERGNADLVDLIQRINRTNSTTQLDADLTLADALAVRDSLKLRHTVHRELAQAATITQSRFSRSEVKFVSTVDVGAMQETADQLAREHRDLDARIQAANWSTELV
ncbi:MAG: DIP1984 family protein [Anaerolineales bacterium]|nr:DIP1984 family protein [Anaerolineales bacterium]